MVLQPLILDPLETRGRKRVNKSEPERQRKLKAIARQAALENIGTLDFETDPFDNTKPDEVIKPFCACVYTETFGAAHFWNEDFEALITDVCDYILALPESYTIYAHNGGKFDFMFMMHKLNGRVSFIGRQLVSAGLGNHQLRDSLKIIPIALKEYKKDDFDYTWLKKKVRHKHKIKIQHYMEQDCVYLFDMVKAFIGRFGKMLTIGQAAFKSIKETYPNLDTLSEQADEYFRSYFYGGRVDCVAGLGHFKGPYKLYDVNSMYPFVMAEFMHPVGNNITVRERGGINKDTVMVQVKCNNMGAFPAHGSDDGLLKFTVPHGVFNVSIHEFNVALELNLISHVKILKYIDCPKQTTFADWVYPLYEERFHWKDIMKGLKSNPDYEKLEEFWEAYRQDLLVKFLLNNGYGKFAQNPRNFMDSFIRDRDFMAPAPKGYEECDGPAFYNNDYEIWEKPAMTRRYNNVLTAASITGGARATLLRGLFNADDPIYADTDSIICRALNNHELHPTKLGAWDLEAEFDEVLIAGKKLYACRKHGSDKPRDKVRSKGLSDMTFEEIELVVGGGVVTKTRMGVTIAKDGSQQYLRRAARATVGPRISSKDIFGREIVRY